MSWKSKAGCAPAHVAERRAAPYVSDNGRGGACRPRRQEWGFMNFSGGFPVDLVLFGLVAAFLVLRLRSILGRRTGFEGRPRPAQPIGPRGAPFRGARRQRPPMIEGRAEPVPPRPVRPLPEPTPRRSASSFVACARSKSASIRRASWRRRRIPSARSSPLSPSGDRVTLRSLLTDETYRAFETAIAAREAAGETQRTEIKDITTAAIVGRSN